MISQKKLILSKLIGIPITKISIKFRFNEPKKCNYRMEVKTHKRLYQFFNFSKN